MSDRASAIQSLHASYKSGDYYQAEIGIREALLRWPNDTDFLRLGALTALGMNQVVTAHQRLDAATDRIPMTAELANIKGRILKESGDWAEAEKAYNLSEELDPSFKRAKINRLNLFTVSEQPKRVLSELASGYDFGDLGQMARAQALTELGQYDEALDVLTSMNSSSYADQIIFQRLTCYAALGQLEDLKSAFAKLPQDSGLRARGLSVAVNSFEMRGQRDQSLSLIEEATQAKSTTVAVQAVRLLDKIGQADKAKIERGILLKHHADDSAVLNELADAARISGRIEESCDLYRRSLSIRPGDIITLSGYAQAAITAGRLQDAQTVLQGALSQSPNNQFLLALVATLLRETGQDHTQLYDYQNFVRVYDIHAPVGYADLKEFNSALKTQLNKLHVYQHAPVSQSLRIGSQTEMDLSLSDDPVLKSFFEAVDAPIRHYMKSIGRDAGHPLRRRNTEQYRISGAWSVKLRENGHHVNHVHPMGWLSSAYYVDVPPSVSDNNNNEGWIKFGEPALNLGQDPEHYIQPKAGRLVLFPSYMWHGTVPFTGGATRLTLPFDVVPA